jgi:3-hydroxyacyl-CoA dehydrogenase
VLNSLVYKGSIYSLQINKGLEMPKQDFIPHTIAVLGAGVMGAQIAAHCVNAGFKTYLFDLPDNGDDKNKIVNKAVKNLSKLKPSPLADSAIANMIHAMNYEQDLEHLKECDLIIEAISERMDWKQSLYEKVAPHINQNAYFASNTSGLSIEKLAEFLPQELRARFCGVHFFNPPRYMHLAELIPHTNTDNTMLDRLEAFLVSFLGKGVIRAKDTPNFIANRIGVFSMIAVMHHAQQFNLGFDEVDALTGVLIGRPKSATFRTMDVVGLDTMKHVVATMQETLQQDPWHSYFKLPEWLLALIDNGALGQKTRCGIYKKQGKDIHVFDVNTMEYRLSSATVEQQVKDILTTRKPEQRLQALRECDSKQAQFLAACFDDLFHYCAYYLDSIADNVRDIDLAVRWGFGWQQGPFETWQASGKEQIEQALKTRIDAGQSMSDASLPQWLSELSEFYNQQGAYSAISNTYIPRSELAVYKRQLFPETVLTERVDNGETVFENEGVRLWHQGDSIALLSFKSKLNCVGEDVLDGILASLEIAERDFDGLIIYQHDAMNFSIGANLKQFSGLFNSDKASDLDAVVAKFQKAAMRLKYSQIPTVAAVRGRALGGGCELLMQCDKVVASFESYIGLVEIGVGLLPAGGGLKEFAMRAAFENKNNDPFVAIDDYFKTVAMAKVSSSATDAMNKGFMRQQDCVVMNNHEVLYVAKAQLNAMANSNYRPPLSRMIPVAGREGVARIQMMLVNMLEGGFISEHDYTIGCKIAEVLCGGDLNSGELVDEQWFLTKEREAFVSLASLEKTQHRVQHMLETGKPLRN